MLTAGSILVEWDAAGRLDIKTSLNINLGDGKKAALEKLLDAARAINGQGTSLVQHPPAGLRIHSANG